MGCDIHLVLERRVDNKTWVGIRSMTYMPTEGLSLLAHQGTIPPLLYITGWKLKMRDYDFFAAVAQVRGDDPKGELERGLPDDLSELSQMEIGYDDDLHSHSWLTVEEMCRQILRVKEGVETAPALIEKSAIVDCAHRWIDLHIEEDTLDEWRIVFAFDN